MGASPQALQQILYANNPKLETLQRVAEALGCDPAELVP
jgi:transcriptional regulator with XRE-family HTH domain